jgi:hypothetical protein
MTSSLTQSVERLASQARVTTASRAVERGGVGQQLDATILEDVDERAARAG